MTSQQGEATRQGKAPPAGGKRPAKDRSHAVGMITMNIGIGIFLAFLVATIVSYVHAQDVANSTGTAQWRLWWGPMLLGVMIAIGGFKIMTSIPATVPADATFKPGWYNDPTARYPQRWWDGSMWTARVRNGLDESQDPLQDAGLLPRPLGLCYGGSEARGESDRAA